MHAIPTAEPEQVGPTAVASARAPAMLAILVAVFAANYMDRQILAILIEPIRQDLRMSDTQAALLYGFAFALFYSLLGIPIARLADRSSRVRILAGSAALFGTMTLACGFAASYWQLLATRIGVAVGEAGTTPPSQSLIADLYPLQRLTTAMAVFTIGPHVGMLLSFALGGVLAQALGWRMTFIVAGCLSLTVAILARFVLREPPRRSAPDDSVNIREVTIALWRRPSIRHLVLGATIANAAVSIALGWTPSLLIRSYHFDVADAGVLLAAIFGIGGAAGTVLGGLLADRLGRRHPGARLQSVAVGLLIIVPAWAIALGSTHIGLAVAGMTVAGTLIALHAAPTFAMVQSLAPRGGGALAAALVLLVVNLIGAGLGPLLIGVVSDRLAGVHGTDSLRLAMFVLLPIYLWAAWHYTAAARTIADDLPVIGAAPHTA